MSLLKINKATTSDAKRVDGGVEYQGRRFSGYNKPVKSWRDGKQGAVLAKKGDEIKIVHFGDPSMDDNTSVEANNAFYSRFGNQEGMDDKFSPLYWSSRFLWPRGKLKGKGPKSLTKAESTLTPVIKSMVEEEKIAIEVIYEPWVEDAHGEWMSEDTVRKACENFNENLANGIVKPNKYHLVETEEFSILKTWIQEVDCFIGDQLVKEGTWVGKFKYESDSLWEMKKSRKLSGVSIGALGKVGTNEEE